MKANLLGSISRIRDHVVGNTPSEEWNKKSLLECLVDLEYKYPKKTAERAIEIAKEMELDCQLLIRSLKQFKSKSEFLQNNLED